MLTVREIEVLTLAASGISSKEIARQLSLSTETVKSYKERISLKLGAKNMANAVYISAKRGLI